MDVFRACIAGYQAHQVDLEVLAVQQGYWSGYYNRAKRPKPLKTILNRLFDTPKRKSLSDKADVDVQAFQQMEAQFEQRRRTLNI